MPKFWDILKPKIRKIFKRRNPREDSKRTLANPIPPDTSGDASQSTNPRDLPRKTDAVQANTQPTLQLNLQNTSSSYSVYAYITGQAIDNDFSLILLQSDGQTPYYPSSPSNVGTPLQVNCAIALGAPGNTVTVNIPRIAGGRIWFSIDTTLTFLLNPGPGLVEPSVTNPSDPNMNVSWAFAEFTYNYDQLYANITFVDFVSLPISLTLVNSSGDTQSVGGLPPGGFSAICEQLQAQTANDGIQGWSNLIVYSPSGQPLRALSPNNGLILRPADFGDYFHPYVSRVWERYASAPLTVKINTTYTGETDKSTGLLTLGNESFQRPTTADIFSSNSGPFTTGGDAERNTIIPQLAAAFNRSTLLATNQVPAPLSSFYADSITNHYSRIIHSVVAGGKGYAFPYDDVPPAGGGDQSGYVSDGAPQLLTLTVGGL